MALAEGHFFDASGDLAVYSHVHRPTRTATATTEDFAARSSSLRITVPGKRQARVHQNDADVSLPSYSSRTHHGPGRTDGIDVSVKQWHAARNLSETMSTSEKEEVEFELQSVDVTVHRARLPACWKTAAARPERDAREQSTAEDRTHYNCRETPCTRSPPKATDIRSFDSGTSNVGRIFAVRCHPGVESHID